MTRLTLCTLALCAGCSIPSVSRIEIAECVSNAGLVRRACLTFEEAKLSKCLGLSCAEAAVIEMNDCWQDYSDAVSQCLDEAEAELKE